MRAPMPVSGAVVSALGIVVVGTLVGALALGGAATPAQGATFVIADGTAIDGQVVQATRNTLTLRVAIGGLRQLAIGQVREVRLVGADGRTITGRLRNCAARRCAIEVGTELIWFEGDRVVERVPLRAAAAARASQPTGPPLVAQPVIAAVASPPGGAAPVASMVVPAVAPAPPSADYDDRPAAGSRAAVVTMAIPPARQPPAAALRATELPPVGATARGRSQVPPAAVATARARPARAPDAGAITRASAAELVAVLRPATAAAPASAAIAGPTTTVSARAGPMAAARARRAGSAATKVAVRPAMSVASTPADASAPAVVTVTARPAGPTEASGEIVFAIELSRSLDQSVVLIYSTVDAGAKAGIDYEARQGILTLPPGTTSGEIKTTVLDDAEPEGDEGFQLFLASDPTVATIEEPWTKIVIEDDD